MKKRKKTWKGVTNDGEGKKKAAVATELKRQRWIDGAVAIALKWLWLVHRTRYGFGVFAPVAVLLWSTVGTAEPVDDCADVGVELVDNVAGDL